MAELFHAVLNASLYASVVAFVIIITKEVLKKKLNAQWHYLIWAVLVIKLLVPFGPESTLSLFNVIPDISRSTPADIVTPVAPPNNPYMGSETETISSQPDSYNPPVKPAEIAGTNVSVQEFLPYAWIAGMLLMLLWLGLTCCVLHWKLARSSLTADSRMLRILKDSKTRMRITKNIPLALQTAVSAPSLFGIFSPRILVSPEMANIGDKELEYILLHELAHFKRKDLFINYLLLILQTVHWFNPLIWYCFKRIRDDMEVATDECVLSVLETPEHRAYGKTLLVMLESFHTPKLAPRLLGMVDDKQNMERRIRMIKMADYFRAKKTRVLFAGLLCLAVLGGLLLTNGLTSRDTEPGISKPAYDAETLFGHITPYVGNSSKVSNLISSLPFAEFRNGIALQTRETPYGVTVNYNFSKSGLYEQEIEETLYNNAAVLFALIDNVDNITINAGAIRSVPYQYQRSELEQDFGKDLREYATDNDQFQMLLNNMAAKLHVYPDAYTPLMSIIPGIQLLAAYPENNVLWVRYTAQNGTLSTWEGDVVSPGEESLEVPYDIPVYWSPVTAEQKRVEQSDNVTVTLLGVNKKVIAEISTIIDHDDLTYSVRQTRSVVVGRALPTALEDAVSQAIKAKNSRYWPGELVTEGHIILHEAESAGVVTAYTLASVGWFGFENGIFTIVSGSFRVPTVITFSVNQFGQYHLLDYREAQDGGGYVDSIREMFPREFWDQVFSNEYSTELVRQQEAQAAQYLQSQGINAEVSAGYVEKTLPNIDVQASNKLFSEMTKTDPSLNEYPYWLGTREKLEDGQRFVYETAQKKTDDGHDLITFTKTRKAGTVVEERHYKIVGSTPELIHYFKLDLETLGGAEWTG